MGVRCFWIEPTGDAFVTFKDGRPPEIHPHDPSDPFLKATPVMGWDRWKPRHRRVDTGEVSDQGITGFGPGAMWDASWMHDCRGGFFLGGPNTDGRFIVVICPGGGEWCIDSRASNCTMPDDNQHRCWVRHGEPPHLTVDKDGITCRAGGGSIQTGSYHGFLRNGEFT